jgi:hypothetical protein
MELQISAAFSIGPMKLEVASSGSSALEESSSKEPRTRTTMHSGSRRSRPLPNINKSEDGPRTMVTWHRRRQQQRKQTIETNSEVEKKEKKRENTSSSSSDSAPKTITTLHRAKPRPREQEEKESHEASWPVGKI